MSEVSTEGKRLWWCGWAVPDDIPYDHYLTFWPKGMMGWGTGEGKNSTAWVGAVIAQSKDEAWQIVLSCYGQSASRIEKHWEPEVKSIGWTPGDRFPGYEELKCSIDSSEVGDHLISQETAKKAEEVALLIDDLTQWTPKRRRNLDALLTDPLVELSKRQLVAQIRKQFVAEVINWEQTGKSVKQLIFRLQTMHIEVDGKGE
jgi:hypothetical protein